MSGLGRDLLRSLAGTDLVPRLISDREWRLGALTVVIGAQRAELRYAREAVGHAKPEASAIVVAMQRALARLAERSTAPELMLPALAQAYATLGDERVALVAVRAALPETTRAQFAWDLARLRREQQLVFEGRRLDLGIATGDAATHRSRVVWIEDERGTGAYYATLRFIPTEVTRAKATTYTARGAHHRRRASHPRADGRER